jgi:hypothetical protein
MENRIEKRRARNRRAQAAYRLRQTNGYVAHSLDRRGRPKNSGSYPDSDPGKQDQDPTQVLNIDHGQMVRQKESSAVDAGSRSDLELSHLHIPATDLGVPAYHDAPPINSPSKNSTTQASSTQISDAAWTSTFGTEIPATEVDYSNILTDDTPPSSADLVDIMGLSSTAHTTPLDPGDSVDMFLNNDLANMPPLSQSTEFPDDCVWNFDPSSLSLVSDQVPTCTNGCAKGGFVREENCAQAKRSHMSAGHVPIRGFYPLVVHVPLLPSRALGYQSPCQSAPIQYGMLHSHDVYFC